MRTALGPADLLLVVLYYVTLALKVWALADAASRPTGAFPAAGKLTKPIWLAILVAAALFGFLGGVFDLLSLVGTVAAIVYLVDVRPAVRELRGGGNGPYG